MTAAPLDRTTVVEDWVHRGGGGEKMLSEGKLREKK